MNVLQLSLTLVYFGLQVAMALLLYLILRAITTLLTRLVAAITEFASTGAKATEALIHSNEALAKATAVNEHLSLLLAEKEIGKPSDTP